MKVGKPTIPIKIFKINYNIWGEFHKWCLNIFIFSISVSQIFFLSELCIFYFGISTLFLFNLKRNLRDSIKIFFWNNSQSLVV